MALKKKITEYAVQATTFVNGDMFDVSKLLSTGPDVWESQKYPFATIKTNILNNTGVTAGSYTYTNITVDSAGRITAASSGSVGLVVGTTDISNGVVGRVLIQGAGNVLQQVENIFVDQANARFGIGTESPSSKLQVHTLNTDGTSVYKVSNPDGTLFNVAAYGFTYNVGGLSIGTSTDVNYGLFVRGLNTNIALFRAPSTNQSIDIRASGSDIIFEMYNSAVESKIYFSTNNGSILKENVGIGDFANTTNVTSKLHVNGVGSTPFTYSLKIDNSLSIPLLHVRDDGSTGIGVTSFATSAKLQIDSTTQGVLFPRMTTTQKNAISLPVAGLVVYDTTLAKLCVYTTAWEIIQSL